jgi:SAM-dependent methyltransferase
MHDTAFSSGDYFAEIYGKPGFTVIDIGGADVNGSLRKCFENRGMKFICVDLDQHPSVDIVVKPGEKLPFEDASVDLVVSSSCFEHDPCFWITFKEMCRITKLDGYIFVNAPSDGMYHMHPGDNWRFYPDAGQALAYWSSFSYGNEHVNPVKVEETFFIKPYKDIWTDFVCVWKRVEDKTDKIIVPDNVKFGEGPLKKKLIESGFTIVCIN